MEGQAEQQAEALNILIENKLTWGVNNASKL
jgi:hypothetical protein